MEGEWRWLVDGGVGAKGLKKGEGGSKESVIDSPNSPSDTVQRRDYDVISSHL